MNRKAQLEEIVPFIIGFAVLIVLVPLFIAMFNSISCQNEKSSISSLQSQLVACQGQVAAENQKLQNALSGLGACQNNFALCQGQIENCTQNYQTLQAKCSPEEQAKTEFIFVKIFSDKILLFEKIVLYHVQLFGLFLSLGVSFTLKFFNVKVHIHTLTEQNQRKVVKAIRNHLVQHPYTPLLVMVGIIIGTNATLWIMSLF